MKHKKISVSHILSNPFRNIKKYPLDDAKVKRLMDKMTKTKAGFHDNLLVRPHPKKKEYYELGYGHHRIEAVKRLGIKDIEPSVCDLDDSEMLLTMFDENSETMNDLSFQIFTVETAKKYLDGILAKCLTYNDVMAYNVISHLITSTKAFANAKRNGTGAVIITEFLNGESVRPKRGKQYTTGLQWTQRTISSALTIIRLPDDSDEYLKKLEEEKKKKKEEEEKKAEKEKAEKKKKRKEEGKEKEEEEEEEEEEKEEEKEEEEKKKKKWPVSKKAILLFTSLNQTDAFSKAVQKYHLAIKKQYTLAKELADEGAGWATIERRVKKAANKKDVDRFELIGDEFKSIVTASKNLTTKISSFMSLCSKNKVRELKGVKVSAGLMEIGVLHKKMKKMLAMEPHEETETSQKLLEGGKS